MNKGIGIDQYAYLLPPSKVLACSTLPNIESPDVGNNGLLFEGPAVKSYGGYLVAA